MSSASSAAPVTRSATARVLSPGPIPTAATVSCSGADDGDELAAREGPAVTGSTGPLVVACLRHSDPRPEVDPLTGAVRRSGHGAGPAPAELAALELALRLAETWHGQALAIVA